MGIRRGEITTKIVSDGLVFNMDPANRASTIPSTSTTETFNTIDTSISGSIITDGTWEAGSPPTLDFDGTDDRILIQDGSSGPYSSLGANTTCNIWVNYGC